MKYTEENRYCNNCIMTTKHESKQDKGRQFYRCLNCGQIKDVRSLSEWQKKMPQIHLRKSRLFD